MESFILRLIRNLGRFRVGEGTVFLLEGIILRRGLREKGSREMDQETTARAQTGHVVVAEVVRSS